MQKLIRLFNYFRSYHQTLRELNHLSDRDLKDIGISRGQIHHVALEHAKMFTN